MFIFIQSNAMFIRMTFILSFSSSIIFPFHFISKYFNYIIVYYVFLSFDHVIHSRTKIIRCSSTPVFYHHFITLYIHAPTQWNKYSNPVHTLSGTFNATLTRTGGKNEIGTDLLQRLFRQTLLFRNNIIVTTENFFPSCYIAISY